MIIKLHAYANHWIVRNDNDPIKLPNLLTVYDNDWISLIRLYNIMSDIYRAFYIKVFYFRCFAGLALGLGLCFILKFFFFFL